MAILNSLIVNGSGRILNKLYVNDLAVSGDVTFKNISAVTGTFSGNLGVTGSGTFGTLGVTGNTTLTTMIATGTAVFNKTTNASGTANNSPALIVGGTATSTHLELDSSQIIAKGSGTTTAPLYLNDGGVVYLSTASKIHANNGTFTTQTLIASTSASIASLTSPKIVADNVNVLDTLRAASFSIDSISAIGSSLYISPTIIFSPNVTVAITNINTSTNTVTAAIIDSTTINTDTIGGVQWTQYSKIKISGKIGNVILEDSIATDSGTSIKGTCNGVLTAKMNTTSGRINCTFTCNQAADLSVKTYSASEVKDLRVMIYEKGVNSTTSYPVGILLTGYGYNNNSYIDIYQGENSRTKPRVRLGKLDGLDDSLKIANQSFEGFGLFCDNTYVKGTVYATSGLMGGWTISDDRIYHTANAPASNSMVLSPGGVTSSTSIGGSSGSNTWAFTIKNIFGVTTSGALYSTSGIIGGWTIGSSDLHNGTNSMTSTTAGLYLGTGGIRNYNSSTKYVNITGGVITAVGANISGTLTATAGAIGGFKIDSTSIRTNDVAVTSNADNSISLSSSDFTRTVAGASRTGLRMAIGDKFGVTGDGVIYASSVDLTGKITADSGKIGSFDINSTTLYSNNHTAWNTNANGIYMSSSGIAGGKQGVWYLWNDGSAKIGALTLTAAGVLSVPAANITGTLTASQINVSSLNAVSTVIGTGTNKITLGADSTNASIYYGMSTLANTSSNGFYIGTDGIALGKGAFKVTSAGALTATSATITGVVNANTGTFGGSSGFTIAAGKMYSGSHSTLADTANDGVYVGTDGISLGKGKFKVTNTGALDATSGVIGGWSILGSSLYTISSITSGTASNQYAVYLLKATASNNDVFEAGYRTYNGSTYGSWVWNTYIRADGYLFSKSGQIGGFTLSADSLSSGTCGNDASIFLSTADIASKTIAGRTGSDWRLTVGSHFGVTNTGAVYCNSANITGVITASSGVIGGVTVNSSYGLYTNSKTSSTSTNSGVLISKDGGIYLGAYNSSNHSCPFQVTPSGILTAKSGTIGGWEITSSSIRAQGFSNTSQDGTHPTERYTVELKQGGQGDKVFNTYVETYNVSSQAYGNRNYKTYITMDGYACINGEINADSGKIGAFEIGTDYLSGKRIRTYESSTTEFPYSTLRLYSDRTSDNLIEIKNYGFETDDNPTGITNLFNIDVDGKVYAQSYTIGDPENNGWILNSYYLRYQRKINSHIYQNYMNLYNSTSVGYNGYAYCASHYDGSKWDNLFVVGWDGSVQAKLGYFYGETQIRNANDLYMINFYPNDSGIVLRKRTSTSTAWTASGVAKIQLTATGAIYAEGNISGASITNRSDERKKNILGNLRDYSDYKNLFMNIDPILFKWNDGTDSHYHFGIGAQTLQKSLRNLNLDTALVHRNQIENESLYYVNYTELLTLSIPVVQSHERQIQELKNKIKQLENEIIILKERW